MILMTSKFGDFLDLFNAFLSILMTFLYAIKYYEVESPIVSIIETICCIWFILDFLLRFYVSENKLLFLTSIQSLIEYVSVVPVLLHNLGILSNISAELEFTQVLRFLLIRRIDKFLAKRSLDLPRAIFNVLYIAFSIIIISASLIGLFEKDTGGYCIETCANEIDDET